MLYFTLHEANAADLRGDEVAEHFDLNVEIGSCSSRRLRLLSDVNGWQCNDGAGRTLDLSDVLAALADDATGGRLRYVDHRPQADVALGAGEAFQLHLLEYEITCLQPQIYIYKYLDGGLLSLSIDQTRAPQTQLSCPACITLTHARQPNLSSQEIPERNFPWQESSRTENVRFVDTFAGFCV